MKPPALWFHRKSQTQQKKIPSFLTPKKEKEKRSDKKSPRNHPRTFFFLSSSSAQLRSGPVHNQTQSNSHHDNKKNLLDVSKNVKGRGKKNKSARSFRYRTVLQSSSIPVRNSSTSDAL